MSAKVSAVILAAGYSTRQDGRAKAMLRLGGVGMLARAVAALRGGGVDPIFVVTGHDGDRVGATARALRTHPVFNQTFAKGMFSSVRAGISAALGEENAHRSALLILPVDAALLRPQSVAALCSAWAALPAGEAAEAVFMPSFNGQSGHPPLLGPDHSSALLAWPGEGGLRAYLHALPQNKIHPLPLPDIGVLSDLDTPEALAEAEALLTESRGRTTPLLEEAWALLNLAALPEEKALHSLRVALAALRLGQALGQAGRPVDLPLNLSAGLLHDMARYDDLHALAGRRALEDLGWHEAALVTGAHMAMPDALMAALSRDPVPLPSLRDIPVGAPLNERPDPYAAASPQLLAACLCVYLADKFYQGARLVPMDKRFAGVRKRFAGDQTALDGINKRQGVATALAVWFRQVTGQEPYALLAAAPASLQHPLEERLAALEHKVPLVYGPDRPDPHKHGRRKAKKEKE